MREYNNFGFVQDVQ